MSLQKRHEICHYQYVQLEREFIQLFWWESGEMNLQKTHISSKIKTKKGAVYELS